MQDCDVCVTGGGIIGLSIALEQHRQGARVIVVERGKVLSEASQAAAGMLALRDPENPPQLLALALLSDFGFDEYLGRIEALSGTAVRYQTKVTYQGVEQGGSMEGLPVALANGGQAFLKIEERSIDPRQLTKALLAAVRATPIRLIEETAVRTVSESPADAVIQTDGEDIRAEQVVLAMGAWSVAPVRPRKGQMLAVQMPPGMEMDYVVRTPHIYAVPRLFGPCAGQVVIGATVEDAGFSKTTDAKSLDGLREWAAALLPALGDSKRAPVVDCWAGLRPDTPDHLPLIGWATESRRKFIATGHYRNGILLAPGTAQVVGRMLRGQEPGVDLAAFSPNRFA